MSQNTNFFNPSLSKVYQDIEPSLKARKLFLDNLSDDIKALEKKLAEVVCPLGISLEYKRDYHCNVLESISDANFDEYFNRVSCGTLTEKSHWISWNKASSSSSRLLHETRLKHYNIYFKNGGHPAYDIWREKDSAESNEPRPLIECSAEIRIQAADYLPKLLGFIGEVFKNSDMKELKKYIAIDENYWLEIWKNEASVWHPFLEESELPF